MGKATAAKAFEDINAALAVLNAEADGMGSEPFSEADPLAGLADGCPDILAGGAGVQARVSGLLAKAAGTYADSARAARALLAQSYALTTSLPRTLAALQAGTISWQHAKVMVDEAATLDPAGAAALEAHFLDPDG
jgi:hypothetical protein